MLEWRHLISRDLQTHCKQKVHCPADVLSVAKRQRNLEPKAILKIIIDALEGIHADSSLREWKNRGGGL